MTDYRVPVASTTAFPYSAVGEVDVVSPDGVEYTATGFMIDATHLVTAAHVVDQQADGGMITALTFTPGLSPYATPYGSVKGVEFRPAFGYVQGLGYDDYAVVTLAAPIGQRTGWFGITSPTATTSTATYAQTSGYPGDLDPYALTQYTEYAAINTTTTTMSVTTTSYHGQSGSPIWQTNAKGPYAVGVLDGVYIHGTADTASNDVYATALNAPELAQINLWRAQDAGTAAQKPTGAYVNGLDFNWYLSHNGDVAASGVNPLTQYNTVGWTEGRAPDAIFDPAWYLATYSDVRAAGVNPLAHYEIFGWKEGRNPSPTFSTNDYLAKNPDVKLAGVNPLDHYLLYGISEGRQV